MGNVVVEKTFDKGLVQCVRRWDHENVPPGNCLSCIVELNVEAVYCLVKVFDPCTYIPLTAVNTQEGNTEPSSHCIHTGKQYDK